LVLGSGKTWPHDLRFFVGFDEDDSVGRGVSADMCSDVDDGVDDEFGVDGISSAKICSILMKKGSCLTWDGDDVGVVAMFCVVL
jgi:hypothetical protein